MFSNLTFGLRVALGKCLAALVVLGIGLAGYYSTHRLIENNKRVNQTQQIRRELADLLATITDAETGQRGFVITGAESFLAPYQNALTQIKTITEHLRTLTADNPDQQRRLDKIIPLVQAKLAELQRTIDMRRKEGFDPTMKVVAAGEGKELMDSIRQLVGEMDRQELDQLTTRTAASEATADFTKAVVLYGSVGGLTLIVLFGWYLVTTLSSQLRMNISRIQNSSSELHTSATQQTTGAREQAAAINEIATTIKELVTTARQIAESAQRVTDIAEKTADGAREGDQTRARTEDAVNGIRGQVDIIVTHMLDLGRKSQQVGGILEVINELSEQTNILAINASIEAAGAGESGRRFGVVADEIRKLADRVGASTKDIRTLIEEIRSAIHTTIMATESGSKAVEAGARQFREVSTVFQGIMRLVKTTTEAAREIELSTKQQTTAVEQVNEAIASVSQTSRESEISSAQTLQAVTDLTGIAHNLGKLVQYQSAA